MTDAPHDRLLLTPDEQERYRDAGTWHELFDPSDLANRLPSLVWVLALVVLGLVAFPFLWLVLRGLPDRGWSIGRPIGLLLLAWPVWLLAATTRVEYGRIALAVALALLAAGSVAIVVRCRRELASWIAERRYELIAGEAVFWTIFIAVLGVRWLNPDLWHPQLGGEKPMDLAFLNAVVKSPGFPPYDPWYAGGFINYYYFGFVLVAALVELTAIAPQVAYNLAVPTLAACLAAASYGAVLAALARRRPARAPAIVSACLGAAFVTVIGNLGQLDVVRRSLDGSPPLDWWYWNASRAIEVPEGEPGPITEFPAFTYLYADLHPHAMALPFTATALVLAFAVLLAPGRLRSWRTAAVLALVALVLGALWPTNTWDVPTYAGVTLVALVLGAAAARRRGPVRGVAVGVGAWLAVVAAAYLLYLPFHLEYRSSFAGVERWRGARTSFEDYLTVHGFFLFVIASALVLDLLRGRGLAGPARAVRLLVRRPLRVRRALALHALLVHGAAVYRAALAAVAAAIALAAGLALGGELPASLALLLALAAGLLLPGERSAPWRFALALVQLGLALTIAVEYLVVSGIDIGRTNTVFKTYLQVWVLFGVASAIALHTVYELLREVRRPIRIAWRSCFVALLAVTLLYPALATPAKIRDRFDRSVGPTLDGTAFMTTAVFDDRDTRIPLRDDLGAIRWLQREVAGSPVVAEVNTYPRLYGWGNRFAMFTGNPAIVGWDFHERQQRGIVSGPAVTERIEEVQLLYRTTDPDLAYRLLRRHDAEYAVVGGLERAYFPDGTAKWAEAVGRLWDVAYRNRGVTVYRLR